MSEEQGRKPKTWAKKHRELSQRKGETSALETEAYNALREPAEALEKAVLGISFLNFSFRSQLRADKNEFLDDVETLLNTAKEGPKKTALRAKIQDLQDKYDAYIEAAKAFDTAHDAREGQKDRPSESGTAIRARKIVDLNFGDDDEEEAAYTEAKKASTQAAQNNQPEEKFEDDTDAEDYRKAAMQGEAPPPPPPAGLADRAVAAAKEAAKVVKKALGGKDEEKNDEPEVNDPAIEAAVEAYINMHRTAVWATTKINEILRANGKEEFNLSLYDSLNERDEYEEAKEINLELLKEVLDSHISGDFAGRGWIHPIENEATKNALIAIKNQLLESMEAYEAAKTAVIADITAADEKGILEEDEWGADETVYSEQRKAQKQSALDKRLDGVKQRQKNIYTENLKSVGLPPEFIEERESQLAAALAAKTEAKEEQEPEPLLEEDASLPAQKIPLWKRIVSAAMVIVDLAAVSISIAMVLDLILLSSLPIIPIAVVTGVLGIIALGAPIANALLAHNMSSGQKVRRGAGLLALGVGMAGGLIALAVILTVTKATIALTGPFLIGVIVAASAAALLSISVGGWLIHKRHSAEKGKGLAADSSLAADMVQALFMPAAPAPKGSGPSCSTGSFLHPHKLGQPGVSPEPDKPTAQPVSTRGAPRGGMVQKVNPPRSSSHPANRAGEAAAARSKPAAGEAPRGRYT